MDNDPNGSSQRSLAPKKVAKNEQDVGRPLGEPAHEVGKPLCTERGRNKYGIAPTDEVLLQPWPHTVQHLELESFPRSAVAIDVLDGVIDNAVIVCGYCRIPTFLEHQLHQVHVIAVHIGFTRIRHGWGL